MSVAETSKFLHLWVCAICKMIHCHREGQPSAVVRIDVPAIIIKNILARIIACLILCHRVENVQHKILRITWKNSTKIISCTKQVIGLPLDKNKCMILYQVLLDFMIDFQFTSTCLHKRLKKKSKLSLQSSVEEQKNLSWKTFTCEAHILGGNYIFLI